MELLRVSELSRRDFVNVVDGRRLGPVKDMHIDEKGMVTALVLQPGKKHLGLFRFGRDLVIPWNQVKKIGVDTILVEVPSWEKVD
ncbi:MAG: YlmC/YmxH family sporulation protein [Bacillota bacterium]